MKEIRNLTSTPLKIHLPGDKILHLGPKNTGRIANEAVDHSCVRKLLEAKQIEIVGEGAGGDGSGGSGSAAPEHTHGNHPRTVVRPRGDR